ncbi:MAG: hypothetical protein R3C40_10065 [Parvularculaceae bacterium]
MEYFDNLGRTETLTFEFTPVVPASGFAISGRSKFRQRQRNPGNRDCSFDVTFDATAAAGGSVSPSPPMQARLMIPPPATSR